VELPGAHEVAARGRTHDHALRTHLEVAEVRRQTEDRHELGGFGDLEATLARHAVGGTAQPDDDVPEGAVVHVHDALPENLP